MPVGEAWRFFYREELPMAYPRIEVDEACELVIAAYCRYERTERRLEEVSVHNAAYRVRQFLAWRALNAGPPLALLAPVELTEFVVAESRRLSQASMASTVATLRNFARFLFRTGVTARDFSASVPTVARDRFERAAQGARRGDGGGAAGQL